MLSLSLVSADSSVVTGGPYRLAELTPYIDSLIFSTNEHGFESLQAVVRTGAVSNFFIYDRPGLPHVRLHGGAFGMAWEGRLEDVELRADGMRIAAFGFQNGYRDLRNSYTSSAYSAASSRTIAASLVSAVNSANSFMDSNTSLIENPAVTWTETYTRRTPADILDRLADRGDGVNYYEWGVWEDRRLHFRSRGSREMQWYVDTSDSFAVTRSLENLWNSVYGEYANILTAEAADVPSQARYGVKRQTVVRANSDNITAAENFRDSFLDLYSTAPARGEIEVTALFDRSGARWPVWAARSGDRITIRNLSPTLSTEIDQIRTWRIARTNCQLRFDAPDVIRLTPEFPKPAL